MNITNISICTLHINDWYTEIVKYGLRTFKTYAKANNYTFYADNDIYYNSDKSRAIMWYKIKAILKILRDHDYVVWIDADGHILNCNIKIEDIIKQETENGMENKFILCCNDWDSVLDAGFMIIKNNDFCFNILNKTWNNKADFDPNFHEQASLGYLYSQNYLDAQKYIKILEYGKNNLVTYWGNYYPNRYLYFHAARCGHSPAELTNTMDMFCPIKIDKEPEILFLDRIDRLNGKRCGIDILKLISNDKIYRPTRSNTWII